MWMTPKLNYAKLTPLPIQRLPAAQLACAMSTALLMTACATGCAPRVIVIPADRQVMYLKPGDTYTATNGAYIVPPARMQEILRALNSTNAP